MTLGLPDSTVIRQQLPKKAVYEKFGLTNQEKTKFDQSIHKMTIIAEVSPKTVNLAPGSDVKSFFIIEVTLQYKRYDRKSIELLFRLIEQNIVLVLVFEKQYRFAVFKGVLLETDWADIDSMSLDLKGLDLDIIWENIVKTIGGIEVSGENTLEEQINIEVEYNKLQQQIDALDKKMRSEKQPRVKREIYGEMQNLKRKLIR